jgi:hypothetical protein
MAPHPGFLALVRVPWTHVRLVKWCDVHIEAQVVERCDDSQKLAHRTTLTVNRAASADQT